jgi:hypothetical protein
MSDMMRIVREKIDGIDSGEYQINSFPGSTTVMYTVGFALDRFDEIGSERTAEDAFDWLDREQIEIVKAIREERGLLPIQYRQSHQRHDFGNQLPREQMNTEKSELEAKLASLRQQLDDAGLAFDAVWVSVKRHMPEHPTDKDFKWLARQLIKSSALATQQHALFQAACDTLLELRPYHLQQHIDSRLASAK